MTEDAGSRKPSSRAPTAQRRSASCLHCTCGWAGALAPPPRPALPAHPARSSPSPRLSRTDTHAGHCHPGAGKPLAACTADPLRTPDLFLLQKRRPALFVGSFTPFACVTKRLHGSSPAFAGQTELIFLELLEAACPPISDLSVCLICCVLPHATSHAPGSAYSQPFARTGAGGNDYIKTSRFYQHEQHCA